MYQLEKTSIGQDIINLPELQRQTTQVAVHIIEDNLVEDKEMTVYDQLLSAKIEVKTTKIISWILTLGIMFGFPLILGICSMLLVGHGNCSMAQNLKQITVGISVNGQPNLQPASAEQIENFCSQAYQGGFFVFYLPAQFFFLPAGAIFYTLVLSQVNQAAMKQLEETEQKVKALEASLSPEALFNEKLNKKVIK